MISIQFMKTEFPHPYLVSKFLFIRWKQEDNFLHALEVHHLFLLFLQYLFNVQMFLSLIKEFLAQTLSSHAPFLNNDAVKDPTAKIQG